LVSAVAQSSLTIPCKSPAHLRFQRRVEGETLTVSRTKGQLTTV
jgi:hypothetical protein